MRQWYQVLCKLLNSIIAGNVGRTNRYLHNSNVTCYYSYYYNKRTSSLVSCDDENDQTTASDLG